MTEHKAPTQVVEIHGIEIAVPTGSMEPPTAAAERIMQASQNQENWKYPTAPYYTYDAILAQEVARCYDWYMGGHELETVEHTRYGRLLCVSSKGYYHYVGA